MKENASLLLNARFRPGSVFHLKEWNELCPIEKQELSGLYDSEDVYGVFTPCVSVAQRTPKVAYRDVAFLWLHLQFYHHLPHCLTMSPDAIEKALAELVLNDILEIEWQGNFVSGSSATAAIFGNRVQGNLVPFDHVSRLSMQAISSVFPLRGLPAHALAARLYAFHTSPWDAADKKAFVATQSVYEFLLSKADAGIKECLLQHWRFAPASNEVDWLSWSKPPIPESGFLPHGHTYKLYISPVVQHLPVVFQRAVPVLSAANAFQFKIGASVNGLLRPDKMVVYFEEKEALLQTAALLDRMLAGVGVQGVPFTSQIGETGLLSWGVDPPQTVVPLTMEDGSWRTMIAEQLAGAVVQAQHDKLEFDTALPFIRAKLYNNGINMETWTMVAEAE